MDSFYRFLKEEYSVSLSTMEYISNKYGEDLSDKIMERIVKVLETIRQMGINPKLINQYKQIFNIVDVYSDEEFEEAINYVYGYYKAKKKKANPVLLMNLFIASNRIIKNKKQEDAIKILELLEHEGLLDAFQEEDKKGYSILYDKNYSDILKNLNVLKQESTYKELIRNKPSILLTQSTDELEKIISEIRNKRVQDETEEETHEEDEIQDEISENDASNEQDEELEKVGIIKLGKEDKTLHVLEVLKQYGISYTILLYNPEILKRKKLYEIDEIIKLLYDNGISFNVLEFCPEILEKGKSKDIAEVIREIKNQDLSMYIFEVCPSILINTNVIKIKKVITALEKNNISKYILNSYPQILISGDISILVEIGNELEQIAPDISVALNLMMDKKEKDINFEVPYIFIQNVNSFANLVTGDEYSDIINRKAINDSQNVFVIKHVDDTQKVINVLKKQEISLDVFRQENNIANMSPRSIKDSIEEVIEQGLDKKIIEQSPIILTLSSACNIKDVTETLKKNRPMSYKKVINATPEILALSTGSKIKETVKIFEKEKMKYTGLDTTPAIFMREDVSQVEKVTKKLKEHGCKTSEIERVPEVLVQGDEKYIDRNFETFRRNNISLPLSLVHVKSARNNEKNIDILISSGAYSYIETTPEILLVKSSKVLQYITIAKENDIKIGKTKGGVKVLNMDFFNMDEESLARTYGLNIKYVERKRKEAERKESKLSRIKNEKLYKAIYPMLEREAEETLSEYEVLDGIAYSKNGRVISKQKVIREAYLTLEAMAAQGGKAEIKKKDPQILLQEILESQTTEEIEETQKKKKIKVKKTISSKISRKADIRDRGEKND